MPYPPPDLTSESILMISGLFSGALIHISCESAFGNRIWTFWMTTSSFARPRYACIAVRLLEIRASITSTPSRASCKAWAESTAASSVFASS